MEDIEDILQQEKEKNCDDFCIELCMDNYDSREDYNHKFQFLRKKYKMNPKKTDLIRTYKKLDKENKIDETNVYQYLLKKIGKSSSGVSVITVLTSPHPEYTKDGKQVKQSFSCGKNCAYCPNEPEIRLSLEIMAKQQNMIYVETNDDISLIRTLTHIEFKDKIYTKIECSQFRKYSFIIKFYENYDLGIGDKIIGVKSEQPRSYLSTEPAVLRANRNNFDAYQQFNDRANALEICGHSIDKIEIIILGGTWDHYPIEYQFEFIRDIYYASNIYSSESSRERLSLDEEIKINETTKHRIIGLTTETRPDCITLRQIKKYRKMNITRVQLGVQHTDDNILDFIERDSTLNDTIQSTRFLKDNGYKVDWHLMPDLPGSSYEEDFEMFRKLFSVNQKINVTKNHTKYILNFPDLQADQLKIYPCTVVDYTKIKEWYENGIYKPYSEDENKLIEIILYIKRNIFPWIRLNRIIRDIPNINILGGNQNVNLRQKVLQIMKEKNQECKCIRCREIKDNKYNINHCELFIDEYNSFNGTEYFINYSSPCRKYLFGFIRLRINHSNENIIFDDLKDHAFIRELHVYGLLVKHGDQSKNNNIQHKGIGSKLLNKAEEICLQNNIQKIAIISGVGVREYYQKKGYQLKNNYMIKKIHKKKIDFIELSIKICIIVIVLSISYELFYEKPIR